MAKGSLAEAQTAADNRRNSAGPWGGGETTNLAIGLKIAHSGGEAAREGQTTVSVALMTYQGRNIAYYVSQDGSEVGTPNALQGWDWMPIPGKRSATGLHAEMALIRHLFSINLLSQGNEAQGAQALDLVVICLNANVCGDCSGWMNAHSIAHCPALATPKTSANWVHPRTGAAYRGPKNVSYYTKQVGGGINSFGELPSGSLGSISPIK